MQKNLRPALTISVVAMLWLTGQRDLFKFGQDLSLALSLLYGLSLVWIISLQPAWWDSIRRQRWLIPALFIAMFLFVTVIIYPHADGLKSILRGSDRDDAVMTACQTLLRGEFPYLQKTYLGNPVSTGPGLLILFLPSALTDWYPLSTFIAISVTYVLIGRWHDRQASIDFVAYLSLSVLIWHHIAVGSDLIVVGLGLLITTELSARTQTKRHALIVGILAGLLGSTRIVFAFLPIMYAFILGQRNRSNAIISGTAGTVFCGVLHGIFLVWDSTHYSPFHLIEKGAIIMDGNWKMIGLLSFFVGAFYLLRTRSTDSRYAYRVSLVTLSIMLGLTAAASFPLSAQNQLGTWQGVSYLMPILPTLVYFWVKTATHKTGAQAEMEFQMPNRTPQEQL